MSSIAESDALHARVRRFARAWDSGGEGDDTFETLAKDIASYQVRNIPGVARLVAARNATIEQVDDIPAVPVEAFRMARVAAHSDALDAARFVTSGTTGGAPGLHPMRTTRTYRELSVIMGRKALTSAWPGPRVVIALAADPGRQPVSSLGFMMRAFIEEFDGRPLFEGSEADCERGRFLLEDGKIDVGGLRRAAERALSRDEPLLVLATGFSLMLLLDALHGDRIAAPRRTVIMPTGGFKGRTREMSPDALARDVATTFHVPESHVVGEYGMTELSSQLYEGVLPGGFFRGERGVFIPPPWLRVTPVRADSLEPMAHGETGIARFVDLGNVDFPVAIVTQDLVRRRGPGVELVGRRRGAPARGCSLAVEEMVLGAPPE